MVDRTDRLPLSGRRIALLETREAERLATMLREQGADVVSCPTVSITDLADPAPALAWLERFVALPPDYLVLLTGEGLRRLDALAQRAGIAPAFVAALAGVRTIARGPKPAAALRALGLKPDLRTPQPTTEGAVALLSGLALGGRRVGVQLYPGAPSRLTDFLESAGATSDPVVPYEYVPGASDEAVAALIDRVAAGEVDAVAFTSASQVRRLFDVARGTGRTDRLLPALRQTVVAAVGPIVAAELRSHAIVAAVVPQDRYFMKPLVAAISEALSGRV